MSEVEEHVSPVAAATMQRDLMRLCIDEFKALPEPWQQMTESEQDEVIERLKKRMALIVADCVQIVACHGFTRLVTKIEALTIKDGVKATLKFGDDDPNRHELFDSVGRSVFIVLADLERYEEGIEQVKADPDQQELALRRVREIGDTLTAQPDPNASGELLSGSEVPESEPAPGPNAAGPNDPDPCYAKAIEVVRAERKASISFLQRALQIGYNRAARIVEDLQDNGVISAPDAHGTRTVLPFKDGAPPKDDDLPSAEG